MRSSWQPATRAQATSGPGLSRPASGAAGVRAPVSRAVASPQQRTQPLRLERAPKSQQAKQWHQTMEQQEQQGTEERDPQQAEQRQRAATKGTGSQRRNLPGSVKLWSAGGKQPAGGASPKPKDHPVHDSLSEGTSPTAALQPGVVSPAAAQPKVQLQPKRARRRGPATKAAGGAQPSIAQPEKHGSGSNKAKVVPQPLASSCKAGSAAPADGADTEQLQPATPAKPASKPEKAAAQQQQQQKRKRTRQRRAASRKGASSAPAGGAYRASSSKMLQITPKEDDLMRWYADVVQAAELAHKESAKGVAGPTYAQALRQPVQGWLEERLEYMGFESRAFPQLMPLGMPQEEGSSSSRRRTEQGQQEAATLAKPSSSTTHTIAQWVRSEGDLPVLASQWHGAKSSSWELHNSGLLLHESHAAHAWSGTAEEHAQAMIGLYEEFARDVAGLPVVAGRRSRSSTLPGAASTFTVEAMVGQNRALQVACSHHLADNYSRLLGASFFDRDGDQQFISQMGSGLQASMLGAAALAHGDDAGLRLPPTLAPVQVVVVPIVRHGCNKGALAEEVERIRGELASAGVRVAVDDRRCGPGVRFHTSERRGVPLRIEVGPNDVEARTCAIARRDVPGPEGKLGDVSSEGDALVYAVRDLLDDAQAELRYRAAGALESNIVDVTTYLDLRDVIAAGMWARGPWAGSMEDEEAIHEETGATLRCIPLQQPISMMSGYNTCLYSGYQACEVAIFARAL